MKITMTFSLPEDKEVYEEAYTGGRYKAALSDLDNYLRSRIKYESDLTQTQVDLLTDVRSHLNTLLNELDIPLY